MKKILLFSSVLSSVILYKCQTISLDALSLCENGINCPDYVYLKDTNNSLNKFIGIWKGTYSDGRTYEFNFTKKENDYTFGKYWDVLKGRLLVKTAGGQELVNTLAVPDDAAFSGSYFDKELKKYQMYFAFNADCNDKGYIYISFPDPTNLNQMKLVFMQERDIIKECSSGYKTVIPDAKALTLTKQ